MAEVGYPGIQVGGWNRRGCWFSRSQSFTDLAQASASNSLTILYLDGVRLPRLAGVDVIWQRSVIPAFKLGDGTDGAVGLAGASHSPIWPRPRPAIHSQFCTWTG